MPDLNQNLVVRVLLAAFICMFFANTVAQFMQISYREPWYLGTWILPILCTIVVSYYKYHQSVKTVLIVEDKKFWLDILNFSLSQKYNLVICKSAEEALEYLGKCHNYDLPDHALIDKTLPGMNGIELITKMTEMGINIKTNIISVSEPTDDQEKHFMDSWLLKVPETYKGGASSLIAEIDSNSEFKLSTLLKIPKQLRDTLRLSKFNDENDNQK